MSNVNHMIDDICMNLNIAPNDTTSLYDCDCSIEDIKMIGYIVNYIEEAKTDLLQLRMEMINDESYYGRNRKRD